MNAFTKSISNIFKGVMKSFQTFPETIACAIAFAIVTMVRIQLDWPEQEAYNLLLNCLHWAFAFGAIFGLAAITAAQSRFNKPKAFLFANLIGAAGVVITFLLLYLFGGTDPTLDAVRVVGVSSLAAARVSVGIFVSFVAFILLAAYPKERSDFARTFFMVHKAFFIAMIYGIVLMGGTSGVAGAIQSLLYQDMSSKVYMYIGTLVGLLTFTIFVGYFPDFRKGEIDERREVAEKQPRFIEILFGYIMIPIVLALTAVLLIWTGKTVATGSGASFVQLSGIATSYAMTGLWLYTMVTHHETGLAKFYRRFYPFAALLILAFEAWALVVQLNKSGLKTTEYFFGLVWILAVAAAILLIIRKAKAYTTIAILISVLTIFAVLPILGYQALPVTAQVDRLENLLISQNMLKDGELIPAEKKPSVDVRKGITDAVNYLAYAEGAKLPSWFDINMSDNYTFEKKFGFEQTWPGPEDTGGIDTGGYIGTSLVLPAQPINISEYSWAVNLSDYTGKGKTSVTLDGENGSYEIYWAINTPDGIPVLSITLDDKVILKEDMNSYIDRITAKFPPGQNKQKEASAEDMSMEFETPEVSVLLVFSNVDINLDTTRDQFNYWIGLNSLYLNEK